MAGRVGKGWNYSCSILVNLKFFQSKILKENTLWARGHKCRFWGFRAAAAAEGRGCSASFLVPHQAPGTEPSAPWKKVLLEYLCDECTDPGLGGS